MDSVGQGPPHEPASAPLSSLDPGLTGQPLAQNPLVQQWEKTWWVQTQRACEWPGSAGTSVGCVFYLTRILHIWQMENGVPLHPHILFDNYPIQPFSFLGGEVWASQICLSFPSSCPNYQNYQKSKSDFAGEKVSARGKKVSLFSYSCWNANTIQYFKAALAKVIVK